MPVTLAGLDETFQSIKELAEELAKEYERVYGKLPEPIKEEGHE